MTPRILDIGTRWIEWSTSRSDCFTPNLSLNSRLSGSPRRRELYNLEITWNRPTISRSSSLWPNHHIEWAIAAYSVCGKQIKLPSFTAIMPSGINVMSRRNCCSYTEHGEADGFSGTSVNIYRCTVHHSSEDVLHSYNSLRLWILPPSASPRWDNGLFQFVWCCTYCDASNRVTRVCIGGELFI